MGLLTYSADKRLPFMVAPKEVINKLMEKTGFSFPLLGIAQEMEKIQSFNITDCDKCG